MTQNTTNNMMDNYFNSDPTNFDETPFHLITTDHPYMATLGLSTFSYTGGGIKKTGRASM
jgi:hypothetical protein